MIERGRNDLDFRPIANGKSIGDFGASQTFLRLTKDTSWRDVLYGKLSTLWWGTKRRHRFSLTLQYTSGSVGVYPSEQMTSAEYKTMFDRLPAKRLPSNLGLTQPPNRLIISKM